MSIKSLTILACLATATLVGFAPSHLHAADTARTVVGLKYEGPIKVVYQITSDDMKEGVKAISTKNPASSLPANTASGEFPLSCCWTAPGKKLPGLVS